MVLLSLSGVLFVLLVVTVIDSGIRADEDGTVGGMSPKEALIGAAFLASLLACLLSTRRRSRQ